MADARHRSRPRRGIADTTGASLRGRLLPRPRRCHGNTLLDERGAQIGHVDTADTTPAFGPLEPTVLLHRDAAQPADAPGGTHPERTCPQGEADREDGNP